MVAPRALLSSNTCSSIEASEHHDSARGTKQADSLSVWGATEDRHVATEASHSPVLDPPKSEEERDCSPLRRAGSNGMMVLARRPRALCRSAVEGVGGWLVG